ncbi:MAG TPA: hypothetical protein VGN72_19800 [Tepidisphaeraceae bacterium]|jgi:hypothetical protein|nr:hypothetical protein [Tepidisphaeraceae bacterium]
MEWDEEMTLHRAINLALSLVAAAFSLVMTFKFFYSGVPAQHDTYFWLAATGIGVVIGAAVTEFYLSTRIVSEKRQRGFEVVETPNET